jgi:energy-coupling factor transport system ATP-binding protein
MIRFEQVSVTYADAPSATLRDVSFQVPEGELCLVVGPTGSGKSTLLKAINGLVPHFTGGTMAGSVTVDGRSTRDHRPRDLVDVIGYVGQDPVAGFVTESVEDELAYGMESLSIAPPTMRKRVEETLDLLGLADVRRRPLTTLSGGQQQRVAIGSVLTTHPRVLVLDEPTSALDPQAAEEVLAALQRLVHDLGLTVMLAEHRLERVIQYADQVLLVPGDGAPVVFGAPAEVMQTSPVAPPVVELGRLGGWAPLPLSVRDARREAGGLRKALDGVPAPTHAGLDTGGTLAATRHLVVSYGARPAVREATTALAANEIVALMGRNGAGKSSLLKALVGLVAARGGLDVGGLDPRTTKASTLIGAVGLVPQNPSDILYADSVAEECATADHDADAESGTAARLLAELAPEVPADRHPADLSEGQRLVLALCVVLTAAPPLLLLDEPTRGLDYGAKRRLVTILRKLVADGRAVVLATHDVELVAEVATRVMVMAEGEIVADGPTAEVVVSSPAFAPQVAKIMAPQQWLTVADVAAALPLDSPSNRARLAQSSTPTREATDPESPRDRPESSRDRPESSRDRG